MCKDKTGILVHPKCNYMLCGSSEQGRKFVAEITRELCKTRHVTQEFPQSFDHHSLGACERTYSTLADEIKAVYFKHIPPAVVFAMDSSANSEFSPCGIIFFPLTNRISDFETMHKGIQTYMKAPAEKLSY